jgi:hypothetical protein
VVRPIALSLAMLALLCPVSGSAETAKPDPAPRGQLGLVVTADVGGGGTLGGDAPHGLFEGEVGVGYDVALGLRPELTLLVGVAPSGHVGLRPGLHYAFPDLPLYVRGALDWSTLLSHRSWRWLLAGVGAELRLTDVMGGFAEVDLGLPLGRDIGLGVLVRAGVSFRL